MSHTSRKRKRVEYDSSPPRCETCKHYRKPGFYLINSLPRTSPPQCKEFGFSVNPIAVCKAWAGADGSTLEPA
jgi:hypothetical protein